MRLRRLDGLLRLRRTCDLDEEETLLVWGMESLDRDGRLVHGVQFFEEYDASNVMRRRTMFRTAFCPLTGPEFEDLAHTVGLRALNVYGDYAYSLFQEETSPFMIWILGMGR